MRIKEEKADPALALSAVWWFAPRFQITSVFSRFEQVTLSNLCLFDKP